MQHVRLESSWVVTALLVFIAWMATGPNGSIQPQDVKVPIDEGAAILSGKTIVVDPGHGGTNRALGDFGTEGVGPAPEKENVLNVALHLRDLLERAGADVVMTRTTDVNPAQGTVYESVGSGQLLARVETAKAADADAFVSIHNDWNADPSVHGTTTYYYHGQSEPLARHLHRRVVAARGSKDLGVRQKGFMVVREVPMPAALVEVGFLSNPAEAVELAEPDAQKAVAEGLYRGIIDFFKETEGA